jgi:hypothetical protein
VSGGGVARVVQAWVALRAEDPEASSAQGVAREHLAAARTLVRLRRFRVFELRGPLPGDEALADLLHRSTQFYNPSKERCTVRHADGGAVPVEPGEAVALVVERGGDRRAAAERWWKHETGAKVEVREGTAWVMAFEPGSDAAALAGELAVARDRSTGIFCNPHAQDVDVAAGLPELDRWPGARRRGAPGGR